VHWVIDVKQMDIHKTEPLVPEPSLVEVEIAIGKCKGYKSPDSDQIPTELIKAGGKTLQFEIHKHSFILYGIRRNFHCSGRNLLLYQYMKRVITLTVVIIEESPSYHLTAKFYPPFFWQG
jgi:hypothetical protein